MKFISSLFLLCFLAIGISAQQSADVTGQLIEDGKIISNQKVSLISNAQNFETITDANGNYTFSNIPDGRYLLVYNDKRATVDITNGRVSISNLAEVIVISSGTLQPISEVSKTVNVINDEEVRNRNEITLTDTLRTIPGFRVQQLGGFGRLASIKTRGLRNQDTAILIDGIRFRDAAAITGDASPFLSDFTTANIGRIEVLRGSGSSIYGTNAIGGVIDFQTPTPQKNLNGSFAGEYGGLGMTRFRGDVGAGTSDGKLAFTTGFSKTRFSRGIDGEDDADNTNFQGRVDYNPFERTNISGRIYLSDAFVRLNGNPDTLGTLPAITQIIDAQEGVNFTADQNDSDDFQCSDFFSGQIAVSQIINSKAVFSASYQGLTTSRENEKGVLGPGFQPFGGSQFSTFEGQIHTLNTKVNLTPFRNNLLTIGYEYELEKYGNNGFDANPGSEFFARINQSSNTIFAQNLLGLFNDKLQLAGGFRVQFFSLDTPEFSVNNAPYENLTLENPPTSYTFDGAASYYFARMGTKIRSHVGNGYRVPSLYERFGTFYATYLTPNQFVPLGAPDLEPERSIALDAGIEQEAFNNRARFSATYFYTRLIDTIGFGTLPQPDPFGRDNFASGGGYLNTKGGISRGAEFSGDLKATDSTDIFASYTYTNSDQRQPQVAGSGIIETFGIPEHQFTLAATQRFGKRLLVNFDFLATSSYFASIFSNTIFSSRIYRFDGNRRGDLTARYSFLTFKEKYNLNIFGTVENIFGNEYFENGFRTEGRVGRIGLSVNF